MHSIEARNVNHAYEALMFMLLTEGVPADTRNGAARTMDSPVFLHIHSPTERVLFDPERNANPFFHLVEAIWMLAGRNDVEFIKHFNGNMMTYSDDGLTFNAAYGHRWRKHFGYDQISRVIGMLHDNPDDRRCVLAMWDGSKDLGGKSLDYPCNTTIMIRVVGEYLDFTITNRSNDLVFGLCGANAVHMSILQEYMASRLGLRVGSWYHLTNNLHIYERHYPRMDSMKRRRIPQYPHSMPLVQNSIRFDSDCIDLCDGKTKNFQEPFFEHVVGPMVRAWKFWKKDEPGAAMEELTKVKSDDWQMASAQWILRALEKRNEQA